MRSAILGLVCLCVVAAPFSGLRAQDCANYAETSRVVGTVTLSPAPALCAADGGRLYTFGSGTLTVLDATDPDAPAPLGTLGGLGTVSDLAVSGGRALLACGAAGLVVVDVSVPSAPVVAGSLVLPASVAAADFAGAYLAAAGGGSFWLIDATNPAAMTVAGQTATIAAADLAVAGAYALVTGQAGIASISLATPAAPVQVGLFQDDLGEFSEGGMYPEFGRIALDGDRAIVKSVQWDLYYDPMGGWMPYQTLFAVLLDVANPASPANVAGQKLAVEDVALRDGVAVVTNQSKLLQMFDGGTFAFLGQLRSTPALGAVALLDSHAYAGAGTAGLEVFDLTYPGTALPLLTFGPGESHSGMGRYDLGQTINWSGHAASLTYKVYDLGNPLLPTERLSGSLSGWMEAPGVGIADAEGELLGLSFWGGGPLVHTLYDMAYSPPRSASVPYWNASLDLIGDIAWVKTDESNLVALDCSALPALPVLGQLAIGSTTFLTGSDAACLLTWSSPYTLQGLDLSDPATPTAGGSVTLPAAPTGARAVFGTRAYVVCGNGSLVIVELADPDAPAILGQVTVAVSSPRAVRLEGDVLAVAGDNAFRLVDVTDPANPQAVSPVVGVPDLYGCVHLDGARLYAGHNYGLDVYNIGHPEAPSLVGHGSGCGGAVRGGAECLLLGGAVMPLECETVIAVPDTPGGDDAPPAPAVALTAHPNPFNPGTRLVFTLPAEAAVELAVFDARGARLRTLATGRWAAGDHVVEWDGRDGRGAPLASGQYLVRLKAAGQGARTVKVTLAR